MDKGGDHGHCALAAAAAVAVGAGAVRPSWRRPAALVAWAIIPVGFGVFLLATRLASGT